MSHPARVRLLDCPFDPLTMDQVVRQCVAWCKDGRASHTVVTMNAALLCTMRRDEELRRACTAGDLVVADGVPIVWLSQSTGQRLPGRVAGVDLMAELLSEGSAHGLSAFFLGARREVVEALVAHCRRKYPGLEVAGWRDGYFAPSEHDAVVDEIRSRRPHMLFVGMPSPFKETWCERHREALAVPVIVGVGGTFDVLTGNVRRAPRLFQVSGMEWSWRLAMEPRKLWRRYLKTNTEFLGLAVREIVQSRRSPPTSGSRSAGRS
jgi:N-acetylglucosaminyldiphosphoundecaprenol N-acetyl-beta-D-mannosaminyltransferase